MAACKKCKKEIPEGALYCPWCGSPQKRNKKKKMYQRPDGLFEQVKLIDGKRVYFRGKTEKEVIDKMISYQEEKELEHDTNRIITPFFKHYCTLSANVEHIQKIYMLEAFPSGRSFFKLFFKNLLTRT